MPGAVAAMGALAGHRAVGLATWIGAALCRPGFRLTCQRAGGSNSLARVATSGIANAIHRQTEAPPFPRQDRHLTGGAGVRARRPCAGGRMAHAGPTAAAFR